MVNGPQNVGVKEVERFRSNTCSGTTYGLIRSVQLSSSWMKRVASESWTVSYIAVGASYTTYHFRFVFFFVASASLRVDTTGRLAIAHFLTREINRAVYDMRLAPSAMGEV